MFKKLRSLTDYVTAWCTALRFLWQVFTSRRSTKRNAEALHYKLSPDSTPPN